MDRSQHTETGEPSLHEGFCQNCVLETKLGLLSFKGQNWFKPTSLKSLSLGTFSILSLLHHLSSWIQSHFDISLTQSYIKNKRDMFKQRKYNKGGTFLQDLCKRKKKEHLHKPFLTRVFVLCLSFLNSLSHSLAVPLPVSGPQPVTKALIMFHFGIFLAPP